MSSSWPGVVAAFSYDFNSCEDLMRDQFAVVRQIFIPEFKIVFNPRDGINWSAFRSEKPLQQAPQNGRDINVPLNKTDCGLPRELVVKLDEFIALKDKITTQFGNTMSGLLPQP